jgi:hypothetical protein
MTTKKTTTGKRKGRRLTVKRPIRDLDVKNSAKKVKGGLKKNVAGSPLTV